MDILIFFAVLFVLILVHELGHFAVAKWTGMRVDEFGIGFPPKLFGIRYGETEYTINLFPIGGFVKIHGENSLEGDEPTESYKQSFVAKSKWAQSAVLLAGVGMNILLAWVLFVGVFATGVQTSVSEVEATENATLLISEVLPDGPAAEASIPVGAEVISISAEETELMTRTPTAFSAFIAANSGTPLTLEYRAGETVYTTELTPQAGLIPSNIEQPAIGVALALVDTVSLPLHTAFYEGTILTATTLRDITIGLGGLLLDAVQLDADFSQVAGPVGIVGLVGEASAFGFTALLMFTAFISLNLAVINLLPFPALDGGRLVIVLVEAIKGSAIRPELVGILNSVGFALLILLMVAVTYNDIARLL